MSERQGQGKGTNQCENQCPTQGGSDITESGTTRRWNGRGCRPFIESTLLSSRLFLPLELQVQLKLPCPIVVDLNRMF